MTDERELFQVHSFLGLRIRFAPMNRNFFDFPADAGSAPHTKRAVSEIWAENVSCDEIGKLETPL